MAGRNGRFIAMSCWKLDASWLGYGVELMPTFQGRLRYSSGEAV